MMRHTYRVGPTKREYAAIRLCLQSWIVALCVAPAMGQQWGHLTGRIVFDGKAPSLAAIDLPAAPCGSVQIPNTDLMVNAADLGVADILVCLRPKKNQQLAIHSDYEKSAADKITLRFVDCQLKPPVALLRTSQTLVVQNKDRIGYVPLIATRSNAGANRILKAGHEFEYRCRIPERFPVSVTDTIHPWVRSTLLIQDHPYMAATDESGNFEIRNIPIGERTFAFRHIQAGYLETVSINGVKNEWPRGRTTLQIEPGVNDLGEIHVPAMLFEKLLAQVTRNIKR